LLDALVEMDLPDDATPHVDSELKVFARASLANAERTDAILAVAALHAEVLRADRRQGLYYVQLGVATKRFESDVWQWTTIEKRCDRMHIWVLWSVQVENLAMHRKGYEQYVLSVCRSDKALREGCFRMPKALQNVTQQEISKLDERFPVREIGRRVDPDAPVTDAYLRWLMTQDRSMQSAAEHDSTNVGEMSEDI
jgi:hypothetical protein